MFQRVGMHHSLVGASQRCQLSGQLHAEEIGSVVRVVM